jgi:hypothetical protein
MECGEACGDEANRQGTDQWNEFEQTSNDPEHDRIRNADHEEPGPADHTDEQTGRDLGANVSRQRFVELAQEHDAARPEAPPGQNLESEMTQELRVLEQEERRNRHEHQPGQVRQPAPDSRKQVARHVELAGGHPLMNRSIDGLAQFPGKHLDLIARLPHAPLILRSRDVARSVLGKLHDLAIQDRKKKHDGRCERPEDCHIDHADCQRQRKHEAPPRCEDRPAQQANQGSDQVGKKHRQDQQEKNAPQAVQEPQPEGCAEQETHHMELRLDERTGRRRFCGLFGEAQGAPASQGFSPAGFLSFSAAFSFPESGWGFGACLAGRLGSGCRGGF